MEAKGSASTRRKVNSVAYDPPRRSWFAYTRQHLLAEENGTEFVDGSICSLCIGCPGKCNRIFSTRLVCPLYISASILYIRHVVVRKGYMEQPILCSPQIPPTPLELILHVSLHRSRLLDEIAWQTNKDVHPVLSTAELSMATSFSAYSEIFLCLCPLNDPASPAPPFGWS